MKTRKRTSSSRGSDYPCQKNSENDDEMKQSETKQSDNTMIASDQSATQFTVIVLMGILKSAYPLKDIYPIAPQ